MTYLEKNKIRWYEDAGQQRWHARIHIRRASNGLWYNMVLTAACPPITDEEWARIHKPGLFFLPMEDSLERLTHRWVKITEIMCD